MKKVERKNWDFFFSKWAGLWCLGQTWFHDFWVPFLSFWELSLEVFESWVLRFLIVGPGVEILWRILLQLLELFKILSQLFEFWNSPAPESEILNFEFQLRRVRFWILNFEFQLRSWEDFEFEFWILKSWSLSSWAEAEILNFEFWILNFSSGEWDFEFWISAPESEILNFEILQLRSWEDFEFEFSSSGGVRFWILKFSSSGAERILNLNFEILQLRSWEDFEFEFWNSAPELRGFWFWILKFSSSGAERILNFEIQLRRSEILNFEFWNSPAPEEWDFEFWIFEFLNFWIFEFLNFEFWISTPELRGFWNSNSPAPEEYDISLLNLNKHLPVFYREIITFWQDLIASNPKSKNEVLEQICWNNKFITSDRKSIYYPLWRLAGICKIKDLVDTQQKCFLSFDSFCNKFNVRCNFLQYFGLSTPYLKVGKNSLIAPVNKDLHHK